MIATKKLVTPESAAIWLDNAAYTLNSLAIGDSTRSVLGRDLASLLTAIAADIRSGLRHGVQRGIADVMEWTLHELQHGRYGIN